ncbi:MAG: PAS domain S-box protein, partial [Deltaproteobacteria bacterium]|nr:PAS domain S-box protein [Deltaproteobacteria bacterium]
MKDEAKTKEQLINELKELRRRTAELERSETKPKSEEGLYKQLLNSSQIGIHIVQDGKFKLSNRQFQKVSGYSEDELLGMDSLNIIHPEDRDLAMKNRAEMLKGERLPPYEFRIVTKGG